MFHKIKIYFRMKTYNLRKRYQRFKRGWAYSDVWDIDAWFMDIIKPMLIHLRDHGVGIPLSLYEEGVENERAAWEAILNEMIECLDYMEEDAVLKKLGLYECTSWKKEDYEAVTNMMENNKNRFFELFGEYFYSLWD